MQDKTIDLKRGDFVIVMGGKCTWANPSKENFELNLETDEDDLYLTADQAIELRDEITARLVDAGLEEPPAKKKAGWQTGDVVAVKVEPWVPYVFLAQWGEFAWISQVKDTSEASLCNPIPGMAKKVLAGEVGEYQEAAGWEEGVWVHHNPEIGKGIEYHVLKVTADGAAVVGWVSPDNPGGAVTTVDASAAKFHKKIR